MKWTEIKSREDLPPEGKYVIAKHNLHTWHDSEDQENTVSEKKLVHGADPSG